MTAVVRCEAPRCSATATPIVAADRWAALEFAGARWRACSQACAIEMVAVLVTVGGFAREPAAVVPSRRTDGTTARAPR